MTKKQEEIIDSIIGLLKQLKKTVSDKAESEEVIVDKPKKHKSRIPRMTDVLLEKLKTEVGTLFDEKKHKAEYKTFVDSLSDGDWADHPDHSFQMKVFAKKFNPDVKEHIQPEAEEDEDMVELVFKKKTYVVGEKSGKVFEVQGEGKPDTFVGFKGVGKFVELEF